MDIGNCIGIRCEVEIDSRCKYCPKASLFVGGSSISARPSLEDRSNSRTFYWEVLDSAISQDSNQTEVKRVERLYFNLKQSEHFDFVIEFFRDGSEYRRNYDGAISSNVESVNSSFSSCKGRLLTGRNYVIKIRNEELKIYCEFVEESREPNNRTANYLLSDVSKVSQQMEKIEINRLSQLELMGYGHYF